MSDLLSTISARPTRIAKATEATTNGWAQFVTWASRPNGLTSQVEVGQTKGFQKGDFNVSNLSISTKSDNLPRDVSFSHYIYSPGSKPPISYSQHPYLVFEDDGSGGGTATTGANFKKEYSQANYLYLVLTKTSGTLTSGDLTITFEDSSSNTVTVTPSVTTSGANEITYETIPFKNADDSRVTASGNIDWTDTNGSVTLTVTNASDTLAVIDMYAAAEENFPPNKLEINLPSYCLQEISKELNIETYESMCARDVKAIEATKVGQTFEFTVNSPSSYLDAIAYGTYADNRPTITKDFVEYTVSSGTITLSGDVGSNQTIKAIEGVKIKETGDILRPATDPNTINQTKYYVDNSASPATIQVGTDYDGMVAIVTESIERNVDGYTKSDNSIGFIGDLNIGMTSNGRTRVLSLKAQIYPSGEETPSDGDLTRTYTIKLIDSKDKFREGTY